MHISNVRKITGTDTYLMSDDMLNDAMGVLLKSVKVNTKYSIPYVAGYSIDGKTIYIDSGIPKEYKDGKKIYDIHRYLKIHEIIEKTLLDKFKKNGMTYFYAHQVALRAEKAAVEADGWNWESYNKFCEFYIKSDEHEDIKSIPKHLDLEPYIDSGDKELVKHMKEKM